MNNPLDFTNKTVWVTGAGRGIGLAIAKLFVDCGATVIGFDLTFDADDCNFECVELDVSNEAAVKNAVTETLKDYPVLDVLVNGAGVLRPAAFEETTWEDFQRTMNVNAGGAFLMLKYSMPVFKAQHHGAVVTLSSNAAKVPRMNMAAYCASKAAVTALTQTAALELAEYGVRCNVVCPGSTDTPMVRLLWKSEHDEEQTILGIPEQYKLGIPLGRIAQPDDIAQVVLFFASPMAKHITMQDVAADGGATLNA